MYCLLCGEGTGFSVQKHHINKLPNITNSSAKHVEKPKKEYVVPDSIEGWSDSIGVLLSSYFENPVFPEYYNADVVFNLSKVRKKGNKISSGNGKSPGPEPLNRSLNKIREILDSISNPRIRPINAYDIIMHMSDAVLSGGIRRSATICLFSPDDEEMYNAKIGNWFYTNPQRGRSNNSAVLLRGETSFEKFQDLINSTRQCGEPGFLWTDSLEQLFNPCVEASLYGYDVYGNSGWQKCNLSSINGKSITSKELFFEYARAAAIIGTLQAGFTDFPYLGEVTERIVRQEALLGVSITGIMENPDIILNADNQNEAATLIRKTNEEIAKKININPASRLTNIKPEGTTSCVLGTSSGIHPHHAKRYFRRVQANTTEEPYKLFKNINPLACEKSVWSNNKTDDVVTFCIEVEKGARLKNDMSAIDLLNAVKLTQNNWVETGTVKERLVAPFLKHSVSNTINVRLDEWEEVTKYIYENRDSFTGISLLPSSGDKDYAQAPFCTVYNPQEIIDRYGDASIFASGLIETALDCFDNLWLACDCVLGLNETTLKRQDKWVEKAKSFAQKYFSDLKTMTYCLKDVHNWKLWCDLKREYKNVDYTTMIEKEDNTKQEEESACAGGKCEL